MIYDFMRLILFFDLPVVSKIEEFMQHSENI